MSNQPGTMVVHHLPEPEILAALGEVAIRHGFLDLVLRRTVKTLANLSIEETDNALARTGSAELRDLIERLARQRLRKDHPAVLRLKALLARCEAVTEQRNRLMHDPWARIVDGDPVMMGRDGLLPLPTPEKLKRLADEILTIASELNHARLEGFLCEALKQAEGAGLVADVKKDK